MGTDAAATATATATTATAPATPTTAPATGASTPAATGTNQAAVADPSAPATTQQAVDAKPPVVATSLADPPKPDVDAEALETQRALAALNRQLRESKAEHDRYKSESAKLAEKVARAELADKARAALDGKDFVAALKSLDPDLSIDEAILTLIDQAKALDAQPLSQADIERITAAKIEEDRKAQVARVEAENKQRLEAAAKGYAEECASVFNSDATGFPLISQFGVSDTQISEYVQQCWERERSVPSPADTMKHFESGFEAKLKAAGYTKAEIAELKNDAAQASAAVEDKKPTATVPVADTHGATADQKRSDKRETIAEYDARKKAELRALRGQAAAR